MQTEGPTVVCFRCGETQPMSSIRAHMQQCPELSDEDFDEIAPTQSSSCTESSSSLPASVCNLTLCLLLVFIAALIQSSADVQSSVHMNQTTLSVSVYQAPSSCIDSCSHV